MILVLKAFSALLSYPGEEMRKALPEIGDVIRGSPLVASRERAALLALVEEIGSGDLLSAQEHYVDLFDRGRALSLHLFEHLHGESRDRGAAMVELKGLYAAAGLDLATRELPDYLPVVLEYLSGRGMAEVRDMLTDCAGILRTIARSLIARRSRYAAVLQALLVIAGEKPVDASAVRPVKERNEALDREWFEQPAFADPTGRR
ncbi:nitrate reductase molybdenum cofactor assembly chaperone [Reyranella sp.]|jgi:nitrate reductase delta subunit|uniref:nitrate reductase molybdenum cofactor assembly chaperone n=1 Tax=Reyranella sp. TaxID=1929291 RepID=UPI002F94E6C1